MKSSVLVLPLILLVGLSLAHAGSSGGVAPSPNAGLSSDQLRAVQTVSQAVLAAKRSQQNHPDLTQLRQDLAQLRASLQALDQQRLVVKLGSVTKEASGTPQASITPSPEYEAAVQKVRGALATLRAHQKAVQARVPPQPGTLTEVALVTAAARARELVDATESFLQQPPAGRAASLKPLLDQLTARQTPPAVGVPNPTPTIRTRTQHRP